MDAGRRRCEGAPSVLQAGGTASDLYRNAPREDPPDVAPRGHTSAACLHDGLSHARADREVFGARAKLPLRGTALAVRRESHWMAARADRARLAFRVGGNAAAVAGRAGAKKIGRASCREREESRGVDGEVI